MKVYLASGLENAAAAKRLATELEIADHTITYRWWVHGSVQDGGRGRMRQVADMELQGVADADVVIVLLPGARGTHVELGAALAMRKSIVLVGGLGALSDGYGRDCAFYHSALVSHVLGPTESLRTLTIIALLSMHKRQEAAA